MRFGNSIVYACSIILIVICLPYLSSADPLDNWHLRGTMPQVNTLNAVTNGNGIFVAVGNSGAIVTSFDGTHWSARNSGVQEDLSSVCYGNGKFVAAGSTVLSSTDGVFWTESEFGSSVYLYGITYGNGIFVAVGSTDGGKNGSIYISSDGISWDLQLSIDDNYYNAFKSVAFGNGTFVAGSEGGIYVSTNGITWTRKQTFDAGGVAFGNGRFVVLSSREEIQTSPDGTNWTLTFSDSDVSLFAVTYGKGIFVATDFYGSVLLSPTGQNWTKRAAGFNHVLGITYGAGLFVSVGSDGEIYTSADGATWVPQNFSHTNFTDIVYANGAFVAVSDDGFIFTSSDGANWVPQNAGPGISLFGVTYGNGIFLIVGVQNEKYDVVLTSTDGLSWNKLAYEVQYHASDVTYGSGIFLAVSDNGIGLSSNGEDWSVIPAPDELFSVTYGNGIFAAGGSKGIYTSSDGLTWKLSYSDPYSNISGKAVHGNGLFGFGTRAPGCYFSPCPSAPGVLITSPDGSTWTSHVLDNHQYDSLLAVAMERGRFVLGGRGISYSLDGNNWTDVPGFSSDFSQYSAAAFGNNTFVVVGNNGKIIQSDPLSGNCTATLSDDLTLHVPIINFNGTYLQGDAICQSDAGGSIICRVINHGVANPQDYIDCQASTLTSDLRLRVPAGIYKSISYEAEFESMPTTDGQMWFKLISAIKN